MAGGIDIAKLVVSDEVEPPFQKSLERAKIGVHQRSLRRADDFGNHAIYFLLGVAEMWAETQGGQVLEGIVHRRTAFTMRNESGPLVRQMKRKPAARSSARAPWW